MSKAAFVLWRDNHDTHLEGFNNFGLGTNALLKRVRLHPAIINRTAVNGFYAEARAAGVQVGDMHILLRFDVGRAYRELYKLLHQKLTVKLKATCGCEESVLLRSDS